MFDYPNFLIVITSTIKSRLSKRSTIWTSIKEKFDYETRNLTESEYCYLKGKEYSPKMPFHYTSFYLFYYSSFIVFIYVSELLLKSIG